MYVEVANLFARYSCRKWCKVKIVRGVCREAYRWLAEDPLMYYWAMKKFRGISKEQLANPDALPPDVDTTPPLYTMDGFGEWEEDDSIEGYSLLSSRGDQVTRYSPWYCSRKIFECTGHYPRRKNNERYDAKRWVEFLANAGYETIVDQPRANHHYVGVLPDEGKYGLVVWFHLFGRSLICGDEEFDNTTHYSGTHSGLYVLECEEDDPEADFICSTYKDHAFELFCVGHERRDVTWVQIT